VLMPWPVALLLDIVLAPLLLVAVVWVCWRQALVLRGGVPLSAAQREVAVAVGVRAVERVRVMNVASVALPLPRWVQRLAQRAGWFSQCIVGMTLGYGIVIHNEYRCDLRLLAHELAHVSQYERLGGVTGFLRPYLRECVWPGYPHGALEREARAAEARGSMAPVDVITYLPVADRALPPRTT
jgi:hypothetical protein